MAVSFRVQHLAHTGSVISTHYPVGGSLSWGFVANQVGDISYQLALDDVTIGRDAFAPYKTDYRLQMKTVSGSWQSTMGGIHVPVNLKNDEDAVNVAGKDWAHWLEQPIFFDYYNYNWNQAGSGYATRKRDVNKVSHATPNSVIVDNIALLAFGINVPQYAIIDKLLEKSRHGANYVNISQAYEGTAGSGALTLQAYVIQFQDETTILQHINNIAALDDPYGFDWTMSHDKRMSFFGPRKTVAAAPSPIWTLTQNMLVEQPMLDIDWTNNGPIGTHIVGLSIGSPALWYFKRDQDSVDLYREWLKLERIGDHYIKGTDMRYALNGLQDIYPHKDVKITILPEIVNPTDELDGFRNHVGDVIRVTWDFPPYHKVDAYYWITEQRFSSDTSNNWKCELGLQQIYG